MKFGSREYLAEVKQRSNADEEYQRLAQDESDSYLMVIQGEPDKGVPETLTVGYAADRGTITEVWIGERETDFVLRGPYGVWVQILSGKLDANKAMMMRKIKVKGNLLQLLRTADATIRWLEVLQTTPTEFEGDYADQSFPVDGGMHLIGEESYIWAIERAMGHHDQIPRVSMCWPPGALQEEGEEETE